MWDKQNSLEMMIKAFRDVVTLSKCLWFGRWTEVMPASHLVSLKLSLALFPLIDLLPLGTDRNS